VRCTSEPIGHGPDVVTCEGPLEGIRCVPATPVTVKYSEAELAHPTPPADPIRARDSLGSLVLGSRPPNGVSPDGVSLNAVSLNGVPPTVPCGARVSSTTSDIAGRCGPVDAPGMLRLPSPATGTCDVVVDRRREGAPVATRSDRHS
jgi:hypothetical protein